MRYTKSGAGLALEAMRLVPQSVGLARLAPKEKNGRCELAAAQAAPHYIALLLLLRARPASG
jgi:hypothetical protein